VGPDREAVAAPDVGRPQQPARRRDLLGVGHVPEHREPEEVLELAEEEHAAPVGTRDEHVARVDEKVAAVAVQQVGAGLLVEARARAPADLGARQPADEAPGLLLAVVDLDRNQVHRALGG